MKLCSFCLCIYLTTLVSLLSSQAVFANTRICAAKQVVCTTSVDSVMEVEPCALWDHGKGHLLYSAATAQSTMDYSRKAVEDDVVDSPPSHSIIPVPINSPSPLRGKGVGESSMLKRRDTDGAQRSLDLGLSHSPKNELHKVGMRYRLPFTAFSIAFS